MVSPRPPSPPISGQDQSPYMSFILKGSQILAFQLKGGSNPRHQSNYIELKHKAHIKLVLELYGTCFEYDVKN